MKKLILILLAFFAVFTYINALFNEGSEEKRTLAAELPAQEIPVEIVQ